MLVHDNPSNEELARILNARIAADDNRTTWKEIGLRMAGVVGAIVVGGAGVAIAALGIATLVRARPDTEAIAKRTAEIVRAGSVVKVTGSVTASGVVSLAEGGLVAMDKGSTVHLADGARVRLVPENQQPRPTEAQMRGTPEQSKGGKVATNYTVFKTVKYGKGTVNTGWKYNNSEEERPFAQYCYYDENLDTTSSASITLGLNGRFASPRPVGGINVADAYSNCVWFN